ncbi:MAG TPA: cupin-like domain-containing protein [Candidatus Solibacter sp.]|nr:cupin-like domain-containing protein [Candidatus Solibacter sp.]
MSKKAIGLERRAPQTATRVPGTFEKILLSLGRTSLWYLKVWIGNGLGVLLLFRSISEMPTAESVQLPVLPMICLKGVLLLRGLLRNNFILSGVAARQAGKVLAHLETHGELAQDRPVPVYDMRTGSRQEFIERFVNANTPVVVKGLSDVEHWSIDWLLRNYGDTYVLFTDLVSGRHYEAPLRDIDNPGESGEVRYLHNSGRLFEQHPHLIRDLALDGLRPVEGDSFAQQLFIGTKRGTGSAFHCAGIVNLFYQLEGCKRWTLVHPEYTFLLYPYLSRGNWYQTSIVGVPGTDRDYADVPLFRYCPRFTVDLEKGDVLLVPSWWYHAVENVTERSLGVATRWRDPKQLDSNRLYNFLLFDPRTIAIVIGQMIRFAAGRGPGVQTLWEGGSHDEAAEDLATGAGRRAWGLKAD